MKKKQLIGILNCTPDSYYEKGRYTDTEKAIQYALALFEEGADIVDIGGESTRPDSSFHISEEEELKRLLPVITGIRKYTSKPLSIDTYKPKVAEKALNAGVNMLNDITGFSNKGMRTLAAECNSLICVMHMQAEPHDHASCIYPNGIISSIEDFFKKRIEMLLKEGVKQSQIILDPGIGGGSFGKTPMQALEILKNLNKFCTLGFPILIGISRKSFMQKILSKPASEILSTTIALNTMSLLSGARYIRVHDVKEHREVLTLLELLEMPDS